MKILSEGRKDHDCMGGTITSSPQSLPPSLPTSVPPAPVNATAPPTGVNTVQFSGEDPDAGTGGAPKLDWVKRPPAASAATGTQADAIAAIQEAHATYPIAEAKSYRTQYAAIQKGLTTLGYFKSLPQGQRPTDDAIQRAMAQYRIDKGLDPPGTPFNPQGTNIDDLFRANIYQDYHWNRYQTYKDDPSHVSHPGPDDNLQFVDPNRLRGLPQGLQLVGDRQRGTLGLVDSHGKPLLGGNGEPVTFPVSFGMQPDDPNNKDHQDHETPKGNGYISLGTSTFNPTWTVPDHGWGVPIINRRIALAAKEGRTITRAQAASGELSSPPGPTNPMGPLQEHINGLWDNAIYFHSPDAGEYPDIVAERRASHGCARNLPQNVQLFNDILRQQRSHRMAVHIE